jgi:hypothetical protein
MKAAGETIIQQGDSGDCFYLLQEGTVEVFVRRGRNGEESLTHTYGPGSTFGELSLLYNAPRAATCRAKTQCVLWSLDRLSFRVSLSSLCSTSQLPSLISDRSSWYLPRSESERSTCPSCDRSLSWRPSRRWSCLLWPTLWCLTSTAMKRSSAKRANWGSNSISSRSTLSVSLYLTHSPSPSPSLPH